MPEASNSIIIPEKRKTKCYVCVCFHKDLSTTTLLQEHKHHSGLSHHWSVSIQTKRFIWSNNLHKILFVLPPHGLRRTLCSKDNTIVALHEHCSYCYRVVATTAPELSTATLLYCMHSNNHKSSQKIVLHLTLSPCPFLNRLRIIKGCRIADDWALFLIKASNSHYV